MFFESVVKHLENTPGVASASAAIYPLLSGFSGLGTGDDARNVCTSDFNPQDPRERTVNINQVTPRYFETMRLTLRAGRDFVWEDRIQRPGSPRVAIVNEAFVKKYYAPGKNPIGERYGIDCPGSPAQFVVIGIVSDSKALPRREASPMIYRPLGDPGNPLTLILRTIGEPVRMLPAIRRSMSEFAANVPLFGEITPVALRDQQIKQERLLSGLLMLFGAFALLLSCIGIYGLLSYTVSRRTAEIGIHMALGAQRRDVIHMVVAESIVPVVIGLGLGIVFAFGLARFVEAMLFGISKPDFLTVSRAGLLFLVIAAVAAALPARRAARIDPLRALRYE